MGRYSFGLMALFLASPAFAREPAPERPAPDAARIGAILSNPMVQDSVAATIDAFADAIMQTRVGPLARYADPRDAVRPDDSLGDLVEREHPGYRRELHDRTRGALAATGQAASDIASLTAELQRTTQRLQKVIDQTQGEMDAIR